MARSVRAIGHVALASVRSLVTSLWWSAYGEYLDSRGAIALNDEPDLRQVVVLEREEVLAQWYKEPLWSVAVAVVKPSFHQTHGSLAEGAHIGRER